VQTVMQKPGGLLLRFRKQKDNNDHQPLESDLIE